MAAPRSSEISIRWQLEGRTSQCEENAGAGEPLTEYLSVMQKSTAQTDHGLCVVVFDCDEPHDYRKAIAANKSAIGNSSLRNNKK